MTIYLPFARISKILGKSGVSAENIPLHNCANMSFKIKANDSLDRFGTKIEKRFNKSKITEMLKRGGFVINTLNYTAKAPYWTFSVQKRKEPLV